MITSQELLAELNQEAQTTRRVLERVPKDKLEWTPHVKSMTLGQLALHLANLPGAISDLATRPTFDAKTPVPLPNATSVDQILSTHDESIAKAGRLLTGMDDEELKTPWSLRNGDQEIMTIPRSSLLRTIMLNHTYHHRGQLTVYLRQVGALVPSIYGASADENPLAA
jgi:uncharacterized damage-inducible protein DinB